jgi:hypothetical protein
LGFVLGGLLTEYSSYVVWCDAGADNRWKAALWTTAGLAAGIVVTAYFVFPPDAMTTSDRRIDYIGATLVTVGLILLQFTVSSGETASNGWATPCKIVLHNPSDRQTSSRCSSSECC